MHPWLLEEVSNHSCSMRFRPDSSTPQTLHLRPGTIRDFFYIIIFEDDLQGVEINDDLSNACSFITGGGSGQGYWNKKF